MSELIAKMRKFKDVKKIAWEMFEKKEIGAVRFIDIRSYAESNYSPIFYFPDIAKEYQIKKIFEEDMSEFTIYSTMGIEFEIWKKTLFFDKPYDILVILYSFKENKKGDAP